MEVVMQIAVINFMNFTVGQNQPSGNFNYLYPKCCVFWGIQCPCGCCSLAKLFLILWCRANSLTLHTKVFSQSFVGNLTVSNKQKDNRTTPISCIYAIGMLYANVLLYTGVGHCIVCFGQGFVRTSYLINESHLHTFFLYTNTHIGGDMVATL